MKVTPRCSCVTRDGHQCGRRVTDGSQPPICHVHRLQQEGKSASALIPTEIDEVAILQRLARDSNPQVRLRAVDLLLSLKANKTCAQCSEQAKRGDENARIIARATVAQRGELTELISRINATKTAILSSPEPIDSDPRQPEPDEADPTPVLQTEMPSPIPPRALAEVGKKRPTSPPSLDPSKWRAVGLFRWNGQTTHALGDEHAARILCGDIPFEQAAEEHSRSMKTLKQMTAQDAIWPGQARQ